MVKSLVSHGQVGGGILSKLSAKAYMDSWCSNFIQHGRVTLFCLNNSEEKVKYVYFWFNNGPLDLYEVIKII
jgi:hypothetical protein